MYKKILVPIDGSEPSMRALDHAVDLAKTHNSRIDMISVIDELKFPFGAQFRLWAQESHERLTRTILESLNKEMIRVKDANPELKVDATIHNGDPADTILKISNEGGYNLIVIGKRGVNIIEEMVMGSVTRKVVKEAKVTVTVVN